ncbi:MAG: DUF433 domain-containing protein [Phycisphaerae bacterium]
MDSQLSQVEADPAKCHGRPVIRGTRVPVSILAGSVTGGMTIEEVAREYDVTVDDVRVAQRFVDSASRSAE